MSNISFGSLWKRIYIIPLLLSISVSAQAIPNIQGKITHQINSPSSGVNINTSDSFTVSWSPTNRKYNSNNIQLAYFMLWHRASDGTSEILRPGRNQRFNVSSLSVGRHTFAVRAVQDYTDGTRKYGGYSAQITVNVSPPPNPILNKVTHSITAPNSATVGNNITISWAPLSRFENLDFSYVRLGIKKPRGNWSYSNFSSNSTSLRVNQAGEWCFKLRGSYEGRLGRYTSNKCIDVSSPVIKAKNLFKGRESSRYLHCLPEHFYRFWHKESSGNGRSQGELVGLSRVRLKSDNTVQDCGVKEFSEFGRTPIKISEEVRQVVEASPENDAMLYVKSHTCAYEENGCSDARAEISYDHKKHATSTYTDNSSHTQEGDIFWVTYRFNAVSLFDENVHYDFDAQKPYVHISQYHPETLAEIDGIKVAKGLAPTFAMILHPLVDESGDTINGKAELSFVNKYFEHGKEKASVEQLGVGKVIDLKSWYQIKIGIKFSTNPNDGWALAAVREDSDTNWSYISTKGQIGTIFRGKTLNAPLCSLTKGTDCRPGALHHDTVFKAGAYWGTTNEEFKFWHGSTDKHLEILFDDFFSSDRHHIPNIWEWPARLKTGNEYIISESTLSNLPFNQIDMNKSVK